MTLIIKKGMFVHLPKTGGSFLRKVLTTFHPEAKDYKQKGWHRKLDIVKKDFEHDFTFSIVRHPLAWYESVWKHINSMQHIEKRWGDREAHPLSDLDQFFDKDFSTFIDNVIANAPGYYSKALEEYLGENYDGVDYIARTETLYYDAARLMDILGIKYNNDTIRQMPKYSRPNKEINWKPGQRVKILELENKVIEKFYNEQT